MERYGPAGRDWCCFRASGAVTPQVRLCRLERPMNVSTVPGAALWRRPLEGVRKQRQNRFCPVCFCRGADRDNHKQLLDVRLQAVSTLWFFPTRLQEHRVVDRQVVTGKRRYVRTALPLESICQDILLPPEIGRPPQGPHSRAAASGRYVKCQTALLFH